MSKKAKISTILLIVIPVSVLVITGASIGIWLGVRNNLGNHPDPTWSFKVSGNLVGGDYNITISELLAMEQYEAEVFVNKKPEVNYTSTFTGVNLAYLFDQIPIGETAVNVTFIGEDGYGATKIHSLSVADNSTWILAYAIDRSYFDSYQDGGDGYLYFIKPQSTPDEYNAQYCIKNVAEIRFA